jgi:hypothetical protein
MWEAIKQFHINRIDDALVWLRLALSFYYILFAIMVFFGLAMGIIGFALDQF